jgi:hypothetical protein
MPRPGKHRSKSVFAEMNEEFGPIKKAQKKKENGKP